MKRRNALAAMPFAPLAMLGAAIEGPLPNITFNEADSKKVPDPSGDLRIYFDGPTDMLKRMTAGSLRLKAGATPHPPHTHPEEEFMVVTEGTGEIFCDGKTVQVAPGAIMYCAGGKSHGILNTGKKPMMFYFFKWKA